ncbi:hypothetical protein E1265_04595 [Streptomyces sp. 8K308]|uniref:hypothetical protein n=1 Tax=Streptomyces sp. 8K308 TaxID=2530388 RepID=UPI00104C3C2A|nr:hypothetical protein [Streptomyces sp. 8K308]TDC26351.1 hypothetical protein E1265_04595 [Streptomyces sp. 8K308]
MYVPEVGEPAWDARTGRGGIVMGRVGPCVQLRPVGGGREWDVRPDDLRSIGLAELLRAPVREANRRSRGEAL